MTFLLASCQVAASEPVTYEQVEKDLSRSNSRQSVNAAYSSVLDELGREATEAVNANDVKAIGYEGSLSLTIEGQMYSSAYLLNGAVNPNGGIFFLLPDLYAARESQREREINRNDDRVTIDVCRIEINFDKLPRPSRLANGMGNLLPLPSCEVEAMEPEQQTRLNDRWLKSGYTLYRAENLQGRVKAALIENTAATGRTTFFDVDAALDFYAAERTVELSFQYGSGVKSTGFADLTDGTRLFFFNENFDDQADRVCVIEGVDWQDFTRFDEANFDHPAKGFCQKAMLDQAQDAKVRATQNPRGMVGPSPNL